MDFSRQAAESHDEAAYRLAAIVASTDDAIIGTDLHRLITFWNPAAERMFGFAEAEIVGRSADLLVPPDRLAEETEVLARITSGEVIHHFETVRLRRDGARVNVSVTLSPIRGAAGAIIGFSNIARDVSIRRRLDEAAYRLAAIVRSSDDAIVSKDLNGIVMSWNQAAEKMFGYTSDEMIGRSITTIIPHERLREEDTVLSKIRAGEMVDHFETVRRRKDGTLVDVSLTVSPVRTRDGRIIGASKIARDITERKRFDAIQREIAEHEERRRLESLESENRRIQEAARIKSEFVANMSHELRTPLHSIIGFTEVWVDQRLGPVPPAYKEVGEIVLSSSRHLLQLINDILDLAKLESGRIEFNPETIDVRQLVGEVYSTVKGLAAKGGVAIDMAVDPRLDGLYLDPAKLKQVFYNYLSNAIKFTPAGGHVHVRVEAEGDDAFRIEVQDTGIGVPLESQHRLFVEFQQLDPGTAKRFQGTGLGLALTKRIVEAQGGTVGFASVAKEGSTFTATLPRKVMPLVAEITAPRANPISAAAGSGG